MTRCTRKPVCTFDKSKPMPDWLTREHSNKNTQRSAKYYTAMYHAQPDWPGVREAVRSIYREAARMRKLGFDVHVDHVYPLIHPLFCGLHTPSNLQIIGAKPNMQKGNVFYPGHEQLDLFKPEPFLLEYQL